MQDDRANEPVRLSEKLGRESGERESVGGKQVVSLLLSLCFTGKTLVVDLTNALSVVGQPPASSCNVARSVVLFL